MNIDGFGETIEETEGFLKKLNNKLIKNSTIAIVGLCVVAGLASGQVQGKDFGEYARHQTNKMEVLKAQMKKSMDDNRTRIVDSTFSEIETKSSLEEKLKNLKSNLNTDGFVTAVNVIDNDQDSFNMVDYMTEEQIFEEMKKLDPLKAKTIIAIGTKLAQEQLLDVNSPIDAINIANQEVKNSNPKYTGSIVKPTLFQIGEHLMEKEIVDFKLKDNTIDSEAAVSLFKVSIEKNYDDLANYLKIPTNQSQSTLKYR